MKKLLLAFCSIVLLLSLLASCARTNDPIVSETITESEVVSEMGTTTETIFRPITWPDIYGYTFTHLSDFYLYAENFEKDTTKYIELPKELEEQNIPTFVRRQVKYLFKLDQIFCDVDMLKYGLDSIYVNKHHGYTYNFGDAMSIVVGDKSVLKEKFSSATSSFNTREDSEKRYFEFRLTDEKYWNTIFITIIVNKNVDNEFDTYPDDELSWLNSDQMPVIYEKMNKIYEQLKTIELEPYYHFIVTP